MFSIFKNKTIKLGDSVQVESADGTILSLSAKVTAISECKKYIQTALGNSYLPANQIKKLK